ncbi:MAG: septation regulator SpoVG [Clostridia bacterium]|nr:septation regulator SpoVG [Clostridia bacterium]
MKISDVRVRIVKNDTSKIKASASITIDDCFVVHDIKIIEGNEGFFIAMPSRKTPDGEFKDIVHPLNTETREQIRDIVLKAFEEAKNSAE